MLLFVKHEGNIPLQVAPSFSFTVALGLFVLLPTYVEGIYLTTGRG